MEKKHKTDVKPAFRDALINDIIPSLEILRDKEAKHLNWLRLHDAPQDFIAIAEKYYSHYIQRINEYLEYAKKQ